jgi:hypothetical protein
LICREYMYRAVRIYNCNANIYFNQKCLWKNLIPVHVMIKIPNTFPGLLCTYTPYISNFFTNIFLIFLTLVILYLNSHFIIYILIYYNNHVNKISYFLGHCQLCINTFVGYSLKVALWKRPKHVAVTIF